MAISTKNDHPENSDAGKQAKADAVQADKQVASGPQEVIDRETAQNGGVGNCGTRRLSVMCISSLACAALHSRT